ncbi:hypothetical protein V6N13_011212 [Hibiscus sabdariffa]
MEDVFSGSKHSRRSGRVDEDEEALKWAAIEKLPTYDRLRTSIMQSFVDQEIVGNRVEHKAVDVTKLDMNDRQKFIDVLFKVAEEDNEKFLRKFRNRIDKVGIRLPRVEVRYEHLTIEADCYIGSRALPSLPNAARNIFESILGLVGIRLAKTTNLTILKDASGVIKPSRMTLLLGPPSSGKTTLLLALAGKLDPSLKVKGEITYNGYRLNEFVPKKTSAYISQNDVHVGEMTVKETLDFSARCQGVGTRYDLLSELARREKDAGIFPEADVDLFMKATAMKGVESSLITDYTLKLLGLDICKDIIVGDEMQRGISGGQKKRVTTGEMIVGPTKTLFMDEISTGLDSSTTYQIVKCPREHVVEFFESCGFRCPERKGTADFLQEVTSKKDQEQYWADRKSTVWMIVTYYTMGFAPEASRFFKAFLLVFLVQQMAAGLFRLIAGICRTMIIANTGGALTLLLVFLLGGFIIPKDEIPNWWEWAYWVSPLTYGYNAFTVNELFAPRWMNKKASDNVTSLGVQVLRNFDVPNNKNWYWIGAAALLGFTVLFNVLFTFALMYLNPLGKPQAVISEETAEELETNNEGSKLEPRLRRPKSSKDSFSQSLSSADANNSREMAIRRMSSRTNPDGMSRNDSSIDAAKGVAPKRGMVLPFTPLAMSFDTVNYYVDMPPEMKAQVRESLIYSAFLRLPKDVSKEEKMIFVDEVMELVELDNLKDAIVGLPGVTGLSTEQRKRGGQVIYFGPLGRNSHKIIEYFESVPGIPKIKDKYNPATWMLEVSSVAVEVRLGMNFAEHYKSSSLYQRNKALVGTKRESTTDLTMIIGAMYAAVLFVGINNCSTVQPVVAVERTVFYRERAAGMYSALPYAIAQVFCEIPFIFLQTTYYTLIVYAMVGFQWTLFSPQLSMHSLIFSPASSFQDQEFPSGGSGITGFVPWHGRFTD